MVNKIFLATVIFYSMTLHSQTSDISIKILDRISLNCISSEKVIFLNKNGFEILFKKDDVINELVKITKKENTSTATIKIIEDFILSNELINNINLNVCDNQFKLIFNDIGCKLIQSGNFCLKKDCIKIFNIQKVEFFESNAFFGEKTIRFTTKDNKDFWICDLLLSEDYVF